MANISSANGTIKLKGRWTKKAVELFLPILKSWRFYGEYGIQWCETHLTRIVLFPSRDMGDSRFPARWKILIVGQGAF